MELEQISRVKKLISAGEIEAKIQEMRQAGATREEIKAAVDAQLTEWGIEVPEHPPPPWMRDLTDAQREQIDQMVQSMKQNGASHDEIRDAVDAKLQEWGIEVPQCRGPPPLPPR